MSKTAVQLGVAQGIASECSPNAGGDLRIGDRGSPGAGFEMTGRVSSLSAARFEFLKIVHEDAEWGAQPECECQAATQARSKDRHGFLLGVFVLRYG